METISADEYANIRGCSSRYVRTLITSGKLKGIETINNRNRKAWRIPLDQLNPEEQAKYYKFKGIIQSEVQVKNTEQLEDMSPEERNECVFWEKVIKEWQAYRNKDGVKSKIEVDELFITKMKLEHPDLSISADILYRKYRCLKEGNLKSLIDKRGKAKKAIQQSTMRCFRCFLAFI